MRVVVQRVSRAQVTVEGRVVGQIEAGLMILVGVGREDTAAVAVSMAEKVANLRIFEDEQGKMNKSLLGCEGQRSGGVAIHSVWGRARTATA